MLSVSLLNDFSQLTEHNSSGTPLRPRLLSKLWRPQRLPVLSATRLHGDFNLELQRSD